MVKVCSVLQEAIKNCLPKWLCHFASPQQYIRVPVCSIFSLVVSIVSVLNFGTSQQCIVVSHCFTLHFPDDIYSGASFHMLIWPLNILFDDVSRSFVHFSVRLFVFLLLSFKSSLYILDNSTLRDVSFEILFLPVCGFSSISLGFVF